MKKLLIIAFSVFAIVFSGCLKDTPVVDFSKVGTIIEFEYPAGGGNTAIGSGLEYFGGGALTYPPTDLADTATFMVNIASPNTLSKDLVVTIAADPNALTDNFSRDSITYLAMPDSLFTILNTTATVKAGSRQATFQIAFFPSKVDPSKNFMLPIAITNAQGYTVSGNFGHIYFHTIGNPLAGIYSEVGTRYNYSGTVVWAGPPAAVPASYIATTDLSAYSPKLASPDNTHTIEIAFANVGTGYNYIITANANYSSISVDYTFDAVYSNITPYIVSYTPPSPTQKAVIHIMTHYNNALAGAGNDRIMDETFTQQ
jgi:Domain of unknown function (DUF1735)